MLIGLINLEPKIFNTALMQISFYHKSLADQVSWYDPLNDSKYDKIYCSSLFTSTDKSQVPKRAICGGTGFDVNSKLPEAIENSDLDYSIYPACKTSYLWFSRGCIRNCPFCIVRQKEGTIHSVTPKNINPNSEYITVMDNNFFANPKWKDAIIILHSLNKPVEFQGVDVRLLDEEKCKSLISLKRYKQKQIKMAWDNPCENLIPKFQEIIKIIKPYRIMVYVLIGFNSTPQEDLFRVEQLRKLKIDPFVMPYNRTNKYQRDFARWCNFKAIFKKIKWADYHATR